MNPIGTALISIGIIIFLVGYWFLGKSTGEDECSTKPESLNKNFGGGIAGIVFGIIFMIVGIYMNVTYQPVA